MLKFLKNRTKLDKHAAIEKITNEAMEHQNALDKSVAIIGPSKVGKSILSKNYAKRHDMLYVNVFEAMRCDMDLEKLKCLYSFYKNELIELKYSAYRPSIERRFLAYAEISAMNYKFRLAFRKLKDLKSLGYSYELFNLLKELEPTCAALYYKKYENQFVKNLITSINQPCVLDMTHTVSANYDEQFIHTKEKALKIYNASPEKYCLLTAYLTKNNTSLEDILSYSPNEFASLCDVVGQIGTTVALEYPNTTTVTSGFDESKKMAKNKVIVSNPTTTIVEDIIIHYTKTRVECHKQTCHIVNATCVNEMMDIVDCFVADKFPEILETRKQLVPSF